MAHQQRCILIDTTIFIFIISAVVTASNFNKPHSHMGKVVPFRPGNPNIKLDGKALGILKSGKPYQTQVMSGDSGRGLVVQDVDAPTHIVWGRILDYDNYSNMVPKTVESKNYKVVEHTPTKGNNYLEKEIYTRMKVGFPMLKLEFYIRHFLHIREHMSLTWTLDYTKESDFDDSCGYWYCVPHPDSPNERTRVYYSVQVSMFDWVPAFVVDFMSKKALTDATAWVKKYSELEWSTTPKKTVDEKEEGSTTASMPQIMSQLAGLQGGMMPMLPFGKRKRAEEEKEEQRRRKEVALKLEQTTNEQGGIRLAMIPAGWRRYLLVSVVLVMVMMNAAMFVGGDNHE